MRIATPAAKYEGLEVPSRGPFRRRLDGVLDPADIQIGIRGPAEFSGGSPPTAELTVIPYRGQVRVGVKFVIDQGAGGRRGEADLHLVSDVDGLIRPSPRPGSLRPAGSRRAEARAILPPPPPMA